MTRAHVLTDNEPDVQPHFLLRDALYRSSLCVLFSNPLCGACAGSISFVQYGVHNTSSAVLGLTNLNFFHLTQRANLDHFTCSYATPSIYRPGQKSATGTHRDTNVRVHMHVSVYRRGPPFLRIRAWVHMDSGR